LRKFFAMWYRRKLKIINYVFIDSEKFLLA
jgi:hypothetical protein